MMTNRFRWLEFAQIYRVSNDMATRGWTRGFWGRVAALTWLLAIAAGEAAAQTPVGRSLSEQALRPPPLFGGGSIAPSAPGPSLASPGNVLAPNPPVAQTPPLGNTVVAPAAGPAVPPGHVALVLNARFGRDASPITGGVLWRVYSEKPEPSGAFRLVKEERTATPTVVLPAGGYVVHVSFGFASMAKRVQLRAETVRETFDVAAGGVRFEGRVGDSKIPPGQITFEIFKGSQFEPGDKRPIAESVVTGEIVLLPEGTYYVASNYGDGNSVVRSDIRVQVGKLTDVTINHRAAVITLKLVSERGGEALANTAWSVLTPGGDIIKESIGAFPRVILAEGDYLVIARNEGKVFNREFKVEPGFDREIEVMAR
jgi:hypothetical protein